MIAAIELNHQTVHGARGSQRRRGQTAATAAVLSNLKPARHGLAADDHQEPRCGGETGAIAQGMRASASVGGALYYDDHGPPHFHARHTDGAAKIRIDTLEAIESNLERRQLRFVLAWGELHQNELLENWQRARAGETLHEIDPLR